MRPNSPIYLEDLQISPHKRRILQLRFEGHSCQAIADKFGINIKTIYAHLYQIYKQYEVSDLLELAIYLGWIRNSPKHLDVLENKASFDLTSQQAS